MTRTGCGVLGDFAVFDDLRKRLHDEDSMPTVSTAAIAKDLITFIFRPVSNLCYRPGLLSPAVV
jgi:hypothetical protein